MANTYFRFKEFTVHQDLSAMKVTTDACLFGAWCASHFGNGINLPESILDLGTGTGLLALMLAQKFDSHIDAVELDEDACKQARANFQDSPWPEKLRVIHTDGRLFQSPASYDLIISNPPFYQDELKGPDKRKNLAHHSEAFSLPEVFNTIARNLVKEGKLAVLLPFKRLHEINTLVRNSGLVLTDQVFVRQSTNHEPFRIIIAGSKSADYQNDPTVTDISISDESREYTAAFKALLSNYYLAL